MPKARPWIKYIERNKQKYTIMAHSIEEHVELTAKQQLQQAGVDFKFKTDNVNDEVEAALSKAESKSGGKGKNIPDIKILLQMPDHTFIPVMIEVKGTKGKLEKRTDSGTLSLYTDKGVKDYSSIKNYAVNGALHYAESIIKYTKSYKEVIAIGFNGYSSADGKLHTELGVYFVSQENMLIPKKIGEYSDLSFLAKEHLPQLATAIHNLQLSEEEQELQTVDFENQIVKVLKDLNQQMHDNLNIKAENRVQLVCGMIMAGLGAENVAPLRVEELNGDSGTYSNDGVKILNKIKEFLEHKQLPEEKKHTINQLFEQIIRDKNMYTPIKGASPIKSVYMCVVDDIMPIFQSAKHLDFTGAMFNEFYSWLPFRPGDDKNDVVLTPRYVTEFMARLCRVNMDSYVWDYTAGSGGFLVAAMKLMIQDAREQIKSPKELRLKEDHIKLFQLLGIELRPDIYMLAVLNMILMGDGSSHILNEDSLQYNGKYNQAIADEKDKDFPANVFLLNPPYSAAGSGLVFVEKALSRMSSGYAAVLIKETAGAGQAKDYALSILKHSTLLASIRMTDKLFIGKAFVQTAIYLFEVGHPHNIQQKVKFINFAEDGYKRANRKKASKSVNLYDDDHAKERYDEIVNLILNRTVTQSYLNPEDYIEDTITLNGDDWNIDQHRNIETIPVADDFSKVIKNYLEWRVSSMPKKENIESASLSLENRRKRFIMDGGEFRMKKAKELFLLKGNPQLNKESFTFTSDSKYPYFTRTVNNNGILGYVNYLDDEHLIKGNSLAVGMMGMQFFYMEHDFYAGQFTKTAFPLFEGFNERIALWFISWFNKSSKKYLRLLVRDFEKAFYETELEVPYRGDTIAIDYIEKCVVDLEDDQIRKLEYEHQNKLEAYQQVIQSISKNHDEDTHTIIPHVHPEYQPGFIPLYTLRAACGYFEDGQLPEEEGWIDASELGFTPDPKRHFAIHAKGDSMLPKIKDGDICIFEWYNAGSRNGEIVLTQSSEYDDAYGGRYTIKRYHSEKNITDEGWQHSKVELQPLNPDFDPIELDEFGDYKTIGIFKCVL